MSATLSDIMVQISVHFDNSATPPVSTNSEYTRRLQIINQWEKQLARMNNYRWQWLMTNTTLTTTAGTATISLPSDYTQGNEVLSRDGYLKIGQLWYRMIHPNAKAQWNTYDSVCWITGNESQGFLLNISPTPTEALSIPFDYYSTSMATTTLGVNQSVLALGTDKTKIPNELFLVFGTLSVLYKTDDEGNKGNDYQLQADDALTRMLAQQNIGSTNQFTQISSIADLRGYGGIGRR